VMLLAVLGFLVLTVCANATTCPNSGSWQTFIGLGSCTSPDGLYLYSSFDLTSPGNAISASSVGVLLITTQVYRDRDYGDG
jgi:hypothetical protein